MDDEIKRRAIIFIIGLAIGIILGLIMILLNDIRLIGQVCMSKEDFNILYSLAQPMSGLM